MYLYLIQLGMPVRRGTMAKDKPQSYFAVASTVDDADELNIKCSKGQ